MASTFISSIFNILKSVCQSIYDKPLSFKSILAYVGGLGLLTCGIAYYLFRRHHNQSHNQRFRRQYMEYESKLSIEFDTPEPGKVSFWDYRENKDFKPRECIRVVTWNIERGYKLPLIIKELGQINADVILLQEFVSKKDLFTEKEREEGEEGNKFMYIHICIYAYVLYVHKGCDRSNKMNVACEIASALKMQVIFGADTWHINEYHENDINDATKSQSSLKFNSYPPNGCEGNAILTRLEISKFYPVVIPCVRNRQTFGTQNKLNK
ncbi:hypothetical protein RFI_20394 [Reticulomyxa filosa]|uniref:Endonuclease/exonuclease/phosphatase domain-containing protein n=1 Tax=Reticulomyxa filosa TaxID=46433 RepID=X6MSL2_RETFI|nr:hypothetical protein RFI_20394 [Reticulomyxa filosa]|eukprot:ETO16943.1 hypothetical protein RFI_20394 [Reticulomyxa filosa]